MERGEGSDVPSGKQISSSQGSEHGSREDVKSMESLENFEKQTQQPVYQIRPYFSEKFKPLSAKEIIHEVLFEQLSTKTWDKHEAGQWSKNIADLIRDKVKGLTDLK